MKGAAPKKARAYRLSPLALSIIDRLAAMGRVTKTAALERALRVHFKTEMIGKCHACGKPLARSSRPSSGLGRVYHLAYTGDLEIFDAGVKCGCWSAIVKSGKRGYKPPAGGPRLYTRENLP